VKVRLIDTLNTIPAVQEYVTSRVRWRLTALSEKVGYRTRRAIDAAARPAFFRSIRAPRVYLRPHLTLEEFFRRLKSWGAEYVVLRWFEKLPHVEPDEDIDLLVADQDVEKVYSLLTPLRLGQPFDVFSVSAIRGTSYNGLPYYPPDLARSILRHREWRDGIAVPDPYHHFVSLAYHAVYHKGQRSGLMRKGAACSEPADHDYEAVLGALARTIGVEAGDLSFEALHQFLSTEGWTPRFDTLRKLSIGDPWIADLIPAPQRDIVEGTGEFMIFVTREWAQENGKLDYIVNELDRTGIDVLATIVLSDEQRAAATRMLRGQKWDRGPQPVSGGPPACFIACFDPEPEPTTADERRKQPFVRNRHLFLKEEIRDRINRELPFWQWTNCLHAADDEIEAWDYVASVIPEQLGDLRIKVEQRRALVITSGRTVMR
jgi:hypothetical protein